MAIRVIDIRTREAIDYGEEGDDAGASDGAVPCGGCSCGGGAVESCANNDVERGVSAGVDTGQADEDPAHKSIDYSTLAGALIGDVRGAVSSCIGSVMENPEFSKRDLIRFFNRGLQSLRASDFEKAYKYFTLISDHAPTALFFEGLTQLELPNISKSDIIKAIIKILNSLRLRLNEFDDPKYQCQIYSLADTLSSIHKWGLLSLDEGLLQFRTKDQLYDSMERITEIFERELRALNTYIYRSL